MLEYKILVFFKRCNIVFKTLMIKGVPEKWRVPFPTDRGRVWRRHWGQKKGGSGGPTGRLKEEGSLYPPQPSAAASEIESCSQRQNRQENRWGRQTTAIKASTTSAQVAPPPEPTYSRALASGPHHKSEPRPRCPIQSPKQVGRGSGDTLSSFQVSDSPPLGAACQEWWRAGLLDGGEERERWGHPQG